MQHRRIGQIALLTLLFWAGAALRSAAGQTALAELFPRANEVSGWSLKEGPKFYTGDQIFDYMDGAGEIPRSYAFHQLGSAKYQKGVRVLEVVIFDMGTAASAFGYYSARSFLEHSPKSKDRIVPLDHPARLYTAVGVLTLWKDHYTIIVQPEIGTPDAPTLIQFARSVSARIKPKGQMPELISRLPRPNLQANTLRYVRGKSAFDSLLMFLPTDVFGMGNKPEAAGAEYTLAKQTTTLFVVRYATPQAAASAYNAYRQYLTAHRAAFAASSPPNSFAARTSKEKGTGAVTSGSYLGVVTGARDVKTAATGLQSLLGTLRTKAGRVGAVRYSERVR